MRIEKVIERPVFIEKPVEVCREVLKTSPAKDAYYNEVMFEN